MWLNDVRHQPHAHRIVQQALARDRVPHAYLFHGPDGVGKEWMARKLAQRLLCPDARLRSLSPDQAEILGLDRASEPCGSCSSCHTVTVETHPDLQIIHRFLNQYHPDKTVQQRKALDIGVDVIRHFLIEKVGAKPARGQAKVFIVREADRITPGAQNAMLKTLEEPPPSTFIILLVRSRERMLETTLSRCQAVPFEGLPLGFIVERLRAFATDLPTEQVDWLARFARGSLGRALQGVEENLFQINQDIVHDLSRLAERQGEADYASWAKWVQNLSEVYKRRDSAISDSAAQRDGFKTLLIMVAECFADVIRVKTGSAAPLLNSTLKSDVERVAGRLDAPAAAEAIRRVTQSERHFDANANTQLCVETLLHDLRGLMEGYAPSTEPWTP